MESETEKAMEKKIEWRRKKGIRKGLFFLLFVAVCAGTTALLMVLWNALIPDIIGWNTVNYWQALGMLVLCRLLLGGFGHMNDWRKFSAHHKHFHKIHGKMCGPMSKDERREFIRQHMGIFEECDKTDAK